MVKLEEPDVGGVADLPHAGAAEKYPAAGERSEILERSPYHYLLEDSDVRRWFRNVKRGSQVTAYEWVRRLGWVCREFKVTPQQLARMKPKTATNFLLDMVSELEDRKFSGNYIDNLVKPIRSWFDYKQIQLRSKIKIVGRGGSVRYKGEHVPLPEELKRVLDAVDLRKRVAVALVAFLGVRIQVLGNYDGSDGLEIQDFPELVITGKEVVLQKIPTRVIVRETLSKARHQYESFLNKEGSDILAEFLRDRLAADEKLEPHTPILPVTQRKVSWGHSYNNLGKHLRTQTIGEFLLKAAIVKTGFTWRPYVLRRYADTRLMMAEADQLTIPSWRSFWLGHKGDIEAVYTLNKGAFNSDLLEKMRQSYQKSSDRYLGTAVAPPSEDEIFATMNLRILVSAGMPLNEAKKYNLARISHDEMSKLLDIAKKKKLKAGEQIPLEPTEKKKLRQLLSDGWKVTKELRDGTLLLERL